jgi:hypothetical protein
MPDDLYAATEHVGETARLGVPSSAAIM